MTAPLTRAERDSLLARLQDLEGKLYPDDGPEPSRRERAQLEEAQFVALAEYADRLPRVTQSACPFTGERLVRSFDPFGVDGPWWHKLRTFTPEEPAPPSSFKVLLGALDLRGREPVEARDEVIPGPDVPFVVPRLLELPGMVAVVARIELESGDLAYTVGYFSTEEIDARELHQPWLRQELWYPLPEGKAGWLAANDPWDFDLRSWMDRGKLKWIDPADPDWTLRDAAELDRCPFLDLAGERMPQTLEQGERALGELPSGVPLAPFEDMEGYEPSDEDEDPDD